MKNPRYSIIGLILSFCLLTTAVQAFPPSPGSIQGAAAHWVSSGALIWNGFDGAVRYEFRYCRHASINVTADGVSGGMAIPLEKGGSLDAATASKFRHIAARPVFSVNADRETISYAIKGQLVAIAYGADERPVAATMVQIPGVLDELFAYDGKLGPVYHPDGITLSVWAPTAQSLKLGIYDDGKELMETIPPKTDNPENGVWEFELGREHDRKYYRFHVQVYHHQNNKINGFEVTDPYSVSLSTDSQFSQFADLANDPGLKPEGWDGIRKKLPRAVDITLYEGHVRDFSIWDDTVPLEHRGTYMAFTYNGKNGKPLSNGMRHLMQLREAGLTHLHLLPVNDIGSVIEDRERRIDLHDPYDRICEMIGHPELVKECMEFGDTPIIDVFWMLAEKDPLTERIQLPYSAPGRYRGLAALDGFNWGYDPWHFNAPEGSYSSDPEGTARIRELREMVKALHESGLKIVVDVVYNHTLESGMAPKSVFDKIVPGYYHRRNPDTGAVETSTCCENTAAEFAMMEKLIIDSVILWAKHYKIDSFRFDLMGHHPRYVIENLMDALAELTIEEHGVDGRNIYVYGEGWDFGEVAGNRIFEQATQFNMGGTHIGNFNDRIRDAIRGGNFTDRGRSQGFANGMYLFPNENAQADASSRNSLLEFADRIRVGMAGNLSTYEYENRFGEIVTGANEAIGYALNPSEAVNYIDKHDNETLWDNTQAKLPLSMTMEERVRVHLLSNAFINFGQGVPFYQMGTDLLRSKSMDRNSFDSGDWFNAVDFSMETHKWATGLPPAWDNQPRWDDMRKLMSNPNINVEKRHMEKASEMFREQLRIRYSSPLFRLENADDIHKRVAFHNTGPEQEPGLILMTISDGECAGSPLDPSVDGILVAFNTSLDAIQFETGLGTLELHPVLSNGRGENLRQSTHQNGTLTIPGLGYAVFLSPLEGAQGGFPCNPHAGTTGREEATIYLKTTDGWGDRMFVFITDPDNFGEWLRFDMASLGDGWHTANLPHSEFDFNIVFRDENGRETPAMAHGGNGCYRMDTSQWYAPGDCGLPGMTVYFVKPDDWADGVNIYTFGPEMHGSWPGKPMQKTEGPVYRIGFDAGVASANIVFNDGAGKQTADLFRQGSGCFQDGRWRNRCGTD